MMIVEINYAVLFVMDFVLNFFSVPPFRTQFERAQLFFDARGLTAKVVISEIAGLRFEMELT